MKNYLLTIVFFSLAVAAFGQCDRLEEGTETINKTTMYITIQQVEEYFAECIAQNEKEGKETYTKKEVSEIFANCLEQIKELEYFAADTAQTKKQF